MNQCKRCGANVTPGATCSSCGMRAPQLVAAVQRAARATQQPRATVTTQPTVPLATRQAIGSADSATSLEAPLSASSYIPPPPSLMTPPMPYAAMPPPTVVYPTMPPPVMPAPSAPPPKVVTIGQQFPVFYPPGRRPTSSSRSANPFRYVGGLVGLGILASVLVPVLVAAKHTQDAFKPTITIPSFPSFNTGPTSVPGQRNPVQGLGHGPSQGSAGDSNVMSDLIRLSAADQIYNAHQGHFSTSVNAITTRQLAVDPHGQFRIGVNPSRGMCIVGRESSNVWRLYDQNNPTNIITAYPSQAAAMRSCSIPVRWG